MTIQATHLPKIYGFNKSSEAGPDNFAPSIFLGGCNFRCPYCMNSKLVKMVDVKEVSLDTVKEFVIENKCEWVNISGGEPTLQLDDELCELIEEIAGWGCKVAMSTNGTGDLICIPLLKYVTMDLKTDSTTYAKDYCFDGLRHPMSLIISTMELLRWWKKEYDFDYEFRTTLYKPLVNLHNIDKIAKFIKKRDKWVLQPFRATKCMLSEDAEDVEPYSKEEMEELKAVAEEYCDNVSLRYV